MQDFFPQQYDYDFIPVQHWLFITNTSLLINGSSLIEKYPIKICGSVQKFIAMPHFYELIALQRCQFNEISRNYNSTPKPSEFPRLKPPAQTNPKTQVTVSKPQLQRCPPRHRGIPPTVPRNTAETELLTLRRTRHMADGGGNPARGLTQHHHKLAPTHPEAGNWTNRGLWLALKQNGWTVGSRKLLEGQGGCLFFIEKKTWFLVLRAAYMFWFSSSRKWLVLSLP